MANAHWNISDGSGCFTYQGMATSILSEVTPSQCVYVQKQPKITFQFQFEQKLFEKTMVRIFVLVLKLLEAISEEPCFS